MRQQNLTAIAPPALSHDVPASVYAAVVYEAPRPSFPQGQSGPPASHMLALGGVAACHPRKQQGTEKCVKERRP